MPSDDKSFVDTLVLRDRRKSPRPVNDPHSRWLRLADIALARAREEQDRIKEQIRPHVERYKRIQKTKQRGKSA